MSIAKLLFKIHAIEVDTKKGFEYTSGRMGPIYCDNRVTLSYVDARDAIADAFISLIKKKKLDADYIAGVATGAVAIGAIIAERLKKPYVYIRSLVKSHGKYNQIEGELEEGKTVLVVEDLVNTGGSSVRACENVIQSGCSVVGCVCIVNYLIPGASEKFKAINVDLFSLTDLNEIIDVGVELGSISPSDRKAFSSWQKDSSGWKPNA